MSGAFRRLLKAALGLIAGDAALLLYLLYNAVRARAALLQAHMGEPHLQIPHAWETFLLYSGFCIVGWALVGIRLAQTEGLWPFSILVSTVAFVVYAALLRRVRGPGPRPLAPGPR